MSQTRRGQVKTPRVAAQEALQTDRRTVGFAIPLHGAITCRVREATLQRWARLP